MLYSPYLIEGFYYCNKSDFIKENARRKQVLKVNGYQERNISKIFNRITNNHSLSQSQKQTQATDVPE